MVAGLGLPLAARVAVELWTAAGLLRLAADASWASIATAAAVIGVRRLLGAVVSSSTG